MKKCQNAIFVALGGAATPTCLGTELEGTWRLMKLAVGRSFDGTSQAEEVTAMDSSSCDSDVTGDFVWR